MPRIAVCHICHKIERLVDPPTDVRQVPAKVSWGPHATDSYTFTHEDGTAVMVPEFDPVLEDVVFRHSHGRPDSDMQTMQVFPVEQKTWDRMDVVTEMKKELEKVTGEFYEESAYYKDEALACYNKHGNPKAGECHDWLDDSKRIGPKVPKKFQTYLCHMCPVAQSYVATEIRKKQGWYDPSKNKQLTIAKANAFGSNKIKKVT